MRSRLNVGSRHRGPRATARSTLAGSCVRPSDAEHVRHHRLHADADAVHAAADDTSRSSVGGDVVGVALDRHLGARRDRDRRQHAGQLRRRARSEGVPPPTNTLVADRHPVVDGTLDLGRRRPEVRAGQVMAVGPRGERAVVALARAERDVEVHAERRHRASRIRSTGRNSRSSASRRSRDLVDRDVEHRRDRPHVVAADRDAPGR